MIGICLILSGNSLAQRGRVTLSVGGGFGGVGVGVSKTFGGGHEPQTSVHMHYGWYAPGWYAPVGFGVAAIAATAIIVSSNNSTSDDGKVYYDKGVYYKKTKNGYEVIPPPPGAKIPNIPDGYTVVKKGNVNYYYVAGTFYALGEDGGYQVTKAPVGVKVPYLPKEGIKEVEYKGSTYYELNGIYYLPIRSGTEVMYKVMPKPGTNVNDPVNSIDPELQFPDHIKITYQNVIYYYKDCSVYVRQQDYLVEVIVPLGMTVPSISEEAESVTGKDGNLYKKCGSAYFQSTMVNNRYMYQVVAKPD